MNQSKELLLFGAGFHSIKVMETATEMGFTISGFISTEAPGTIVNDRPVLGYIDLYNNDVGLQEKYFHIAVGENAVRHKILQQLKYNPARLTSIIATSSQISPSAIVEAGCYIGKRAILQNNTMIGTCGLIDTGAIIEHDVTIGELVTVSPGATICGNVTIGQGAVIGAGAVVIEKIRIGENSLIGAGSVVIHEVEPNTVVVGNPARPIKKDLLKIAT